MNPNQPLLKKLGAGYKRPQKTYTDKLTDDDIEDLLEDYVEVENILQVPLGVHLRYFSIKGGKRLFRTGGFLFRNNGLPKFLMLQNGDHVWSVQAKNTIFFRKMTEKEIKEDYEETIDELEDKLKAFKTLAKAQKEEIENLKKQLIKYKKKN